MEKVLSSEGLAYLPEELKAMQSWFAGVITQKLNAEEQINLLSPQGMLIAEEAARYIMPSGELKPHQRIQIYNQQYWWRLLEALRKSFPFVTRLFGYQAFDAEIATPYLEKHPPSTWMLCFIGQELPAWVEKNYKKSDKRLVYQAAQIDSSFTSSYLAPQRPPLDLSILAKGGDTSTFLTTPFFLQPHVHFFEFEYNLFHLREQFLAKEVEYWMNHPFPQIPKVKNKTLHYLLYRTLQNTVAYKEISAEEKYLLSFFKGGSTLENACEKIETEEGSLYAAVEKHLSRWLVEWTQLGILVLCPL